MSVVAFITLIAIAVAEGSDDPNEWVTDEPTDALDLLLSLPPAEVESLLALPSGDSSSTNRLHGYAGALILMTGEGNFPETLLGSDDERWLVEDLLEPRDSTLYPSLVTTAELEWFPKNNLSFRAFLTSGEIRSGTTLDPPSDSSVVFFGLSPREFLESGFWLAEALLTADAGPLTIEFGRRFVDVAGGIVYRDVGTGVFMTLTHFYDDREIAFEASAFATGRDFGALERPSPILTASLRYGWDWVNRLEVFAASYWDRDDVLTDVFVSALTESIVVGANEDAGVQLLLTPLLLDDIGDNARLNYLGFSADGQIGALRLAGRFAAMFGSFTTLTLDSPLELIGERNFSLRGYAFDCSASFNIVPEVSVGIEGLGLSGSRAGDLRDQRYETFVGIAPLWTYSTIFFTSGVGQTFTAARATAAGINGHGVFGGGPVVDFANERWAARLKALALFAQAPIDPRIGGGGSYYGLEPNLEVRAELSSSLSVQFVGGVLLPGGFFPESELAYRGLVLLDGRVDL